MTRQEFSRWCAQDLRLLDGATGTGLAKAGMPRGVCTEAWVLDHPQALARLQAEYAAAGSDVVYAPTFGANRGSLACHGLEDQAERFNRELVAISRRAVPAGVLVAGNMTTLGRPVEDDSPNSYAALFDIYRQQAQALEEAGVDLFAVETMMGVTECMAAVEAIRAVSQRPVMCTLSVQSDGKCYFDGNAAEAARALESLGADAVGVNCSSGPDQLESVVRMMKAACALPIVAKPNAGMPKISDTGEAVYDMAPEAFARHMQKLVEAGARLIGGCCGTSPDYIAALKALQT